MGAALALFLATSPAAACLVCVEQPEETLTDRVWAANAVVLARNVAEEPFAYQVVETLTGEANEPIAFVVNTVERRRMATDPERIALFIHEPRGWSMAGHGGADFAALARTMVANRAQWSDTPDDPDRTMAFAALHAHPDPAIRRAALTELSRVPYAQLRRIEVELDAAWLAARVSDTSWFGWWPILAQMLGLHSDPAAHALVRARALDVSTAARPHWLMALVEVDGAEAIARILADIDDAEAALAATRAFTALADKDAAIAPDIATALGILAAHGPTVAAEATLGLRRLEDWSLAPLVTELLTEDHIADPAGAFALKVYLAQARSAGAGRTRQSASPIASQ